MMVWEIPDALEFIRSVQPAVMGSGWCIFLGGGVLNRGYGPDLDILAYPQTTDSQVSMLLKNFPITRKGGTSVTVADIYHFQVDDKPVELIVQTWIPDCT